MVKSKLQLLVDTFLNEVKGNPSDFSEGERQIAIGAAEELKHLTKGNPELFMIFYGNTPAYQVTSIVKRKGYCFRKTAEHQMNKAKHELKHLQRTSLIDGSNINLEKLHVVALVPEVSTGD